MDFNIGDQVKRKATGEEGEVVPKTGRPFPQGYFYVKFAGAAVASLVYETEIEKQD